MEQTEFDQFYNRFISLKIFFSHSELANLSLITSLLFIENDSKILLRRFFNKIENEFHKNFNGEPSMEDMLSKFNQMDFVRVGYSFISENRSPNFENKLGGKINPIESLQLLLKCFRVLLLALKKDVDIPNSIKDATAFLLKESIQDVSMIENFDSSEILKVIDIDKLLPPAERNVS